MMTLLVWSFLVFIFLGFAVWIYQAIILPTERQRLRFELFDLRDRLRELVIKGDLREESAAFQLLHSQLNTMIKTVPHFDLALMMRVENVDKALKKDVERRSQRLQEQVEASLPEVKEIYLSGLQVLAKSLLLNSVLLMI